ncbi:hypothetical protein HYE68_008831 [Fusarium pseudograminearum]|nr:hypothetical protein HYE68_008831 [Fusarium pseudograminearum]
MIVPLLSIFSQGFDGSMMNGLQSVTHWQTYFGSPTGALLGFFNAAYPLGGILGSSAISPVADTFGRRCGIAFGAALCCVDAAIQGASINIAMFIISRVIIGSGSVVVAGVGAPYITEIAHPDQRSTATALFLTFYSIGSIIAGWCTFGTFRIDSTASWRIPSALQGLPSIIQLLLVWFVPESPRWLIRKGREQDALAMLTKCHGEGNELDPVVQLEYTEIKQTLTAEVVDICITAGSAVFAKDNTNKAAAYTVVAFLYLFSPAYNLGLYIPEILPYRMRTKGLSFFYFVHFCFMMLSTFTVPIGLGNITWRFYIIFIAWVMIEFVGVWLVFPETKGPSLEEIAYIFDGPQGVVGHAAEVMVEVFFEHHRQAFGIAGTKPRITWRFEGTVSDWEQSAYDIEVARNGPKVDKTALFSFNSSNSLYVPWPDEELGESEAATAEINGKRVGDLVAPGWQSYNHRHVYDSYDVTSLLTAGKNAIGVVVGEGWFLGRLGPESVRNNYGDLIGLLSKLVVTLEDGKKITFGTDRDWRASGGPVVSGEIYDGETYEARLAKQIRGWSTAAFNTKVNTWGRVRTLPSLKGKLTPPDQPGIRRIEEKEAQRILRSPSGKTIIDFGQNLVGWLRVQVDGPANTNITFHHAEVLVDGELALKPLRTAKATDTIILAGDGPITWEPKLTFYGFRYVQVDGWPKNRSLRGSIKAVVVHTDLEETGWFECSNHALNQLHSNVRWSMKGNFLSIPMDCLQRDEHLGWTGDAHFFGPTANYLYNTAGFWRGWHRDLARPTNQPIATAVWGDVAVGNPWNIYQSFGDKGLLQEHLAQGVEWLDKGIYRNEAGLWNRQTFQYGDWLDQKSPPDDPGQATTHKFLVADAYLNIVAANDYLIGTGFAGTPALSDALRSINATEDIYRILLQTKVPSWLYQVDMGATTIWERWDSMLPDRQLNPGEMTSFNHYAYGSVAQFLHETVGGLAPDKDNSGYETVAVAPIPGGGITSANAKHLGPYGMVEVSCKDA